MNKLLSVIVAAMFVASSAFVASPAGAQTKDEKKTEKKAAPKKDGDKKAAPKKDAKKEEMKK